MAENSYSLNQEELLKKLKAISGDLWGLAGVKDPKNTEASGAKERSGDAQGQGAVQKPGRPVAGQIPEVAEKPGLLDLWYNVDETIEWTEALAHAESPDGLTPPGLWQFYRSQAEKVLQGDLGAYREVLTRVNPLGELTAFAQGLTIRAKSPDRLEAAFTCDPQLLEAGGKTYLSAMGVRIARDLMACLPVLEAGVTAGAEGKTLMQVTYPREKMMHRNLRFSDPVTLTEECGAQFEALGNAG